MTMETASRPGHPQSCWGGQRCCRETLPPGVSRGWNHPAMLYWPEIQLNLEIVGGFGFVWKCCVPQKTQWFCWSLSLLNGYFIGGIPHFQTYPFTNMSHHIWFRLKLGPWPVTSHSERKWKALRLTLGAWSASRSSLVPWNPWNRWGEWCVISDEVLSWVNYNDLTATSLES